LAAKGEVIAHAVDPTMDLPLGERGVDQLEDQNDVVDKFSDNYYKISAQLIHTHLLHIVVSKHSDAPFREYLEYKTTKVNTKQHRCSL